MSVMGLDGLYPLNSSKLWIAVGLSAMIFLCKERNPVVRAAPVSKRTESGYREQT